MTAIFSPLKFVGGDLDALVGFLDAADHTAIIQEWVAGAKEERVRQREALRDTRAGNWQQGTMAATGAISAGTDRNLARGEFDTIDSADAQPCLAEQSTSDLSQRLRQLNPQLAPREYAIPADHPPIAIPNIELSQFLGGGAFGKVFAGRVRSSGLLVAVKVLQNCAGDDASAVAANEAVNAAKLRHPNVMRVFDLKPVGKFWVIVLEFIEGQVLAGRFLTDAELTRTFAQLADAICHLHEHNIVHRDLKPANILLRGSQLSPVIVDLGMSLDLNLIDPQTAAMGGTPYYMPPEAFRRKVAPAFDAYSLGVTAATVILREMLPRYGDDVERLVAAKGSGDFSSELLLALTKDWRVVRKPTWLQRLMGAKPCRVGVDWISNLIDDDQTVRMAALKRAQSWCR